ncbi:uncharacterized protein DUF4142 [Pontibacter ummariensis]|uniref:DUF4142 domain-containing protein n=2 Tax=Pontibacter ummariensis TaxID=1610492 RepID=A0A239IKX8_9BACT|nr:uncharacterized protein DUF4142 [Pontibacter ummariensis]SNS93888.1 protein of unknown function [Pontibacter ummariensis]
MFFDKVLATLFGLLFLLMLGCDGTATDSEPTEMISITETRTLEEDPAFWDYAASSNLLQVEAGKVAMEQAQTEQIRAMAQKAIQYHGDALKELQRLTAKQKNIQLPDTLGGADWGLVQDLKLLEGEEFDARYRDFVISTHKAQLSRYKEAILKADDQHIRGWLMQMRSHLREEINELARLDTTAVTAEEQL